MKRFIAILFGLILMLSVTTAEASSWKWTYDSGAALWWKKGASGQSYDGWYYNRSCQHTRGRRCCSRCSFSRAYQISGYEAKSYTAGTEGWRSQLLRIKGQQKLYEDRLKESANEHNEFMEAVKELGLSGSYNFTPRYANAGLANQNLAASLGQYGATPYAGQGNTIYGYTELSEVYGRLDLALHLNQAARLAEGAQNLSQQATGGFNTMVDNAGERQKGIATVLAQAQAAAQVLQATKVDPQGTVRRQSFFFKVVPDANGQMKAEMIDGAPAAATTTGDVEERFTAVVQNNCLSCHNGEKAKGGLDFAKAQDFPFETWKKIWTRVRHPDPARRMPLTGDNEPGQPLADEDLLTVAEYYAAIKKATVALQSK